MTPAPTAQQINALVDQVRKPDWTAVGARLAEALRRASLATTRPDGYPSSTGGPRGSDTSDPTYGASQARALPDPIREHAHVALVSLVAAVKALATVRSRLDLVDHLSRDASLDPEPGCSAMAMVGGWEPVHVTTDLGGRLPHPVALGRWAYDFARVAERLPDPSECQAHRDGKRVRVRVAGPRSVVVISP